MASQSSSSAARQPSSSKTAAAVSRQLQRLDQPRRWAGLLLFLHISSNRLQADSNRGTGYGGAAEELWQHLAAAGFKRGGWLQEEAAAGSYGRRRADAQQGCSSGRAGRPAAAAGNWRRSSGGRLLGRGLATEGADRPAAGGRPANWWRWGSRGTDRWSWAAGGRTDGAGQQGADRWSWAAGSQQGRQDLDGAQVGCNGDVKKGSHGRSSAVEGGWAESFRFESRGALMSSKKASFSCSLQWSLSTF
ncbi:hypothetical protein J5N97_023607 [Dioscorea zingiberensis]|uniref:Uncharacterized protein n=1 Tax=Dioscorea zingiberensis TaxID=325984 RepID=A0A9D5H821_9LILI|nr:hypothetical protein J5N97_023607 [Dioscorea zingiberensis]